MATIDREPARGFLTDAGEYVSAADTLVSCCPDRVWKVPYYLYCHGAELSLKAFLRMKGWSANRLKKKQYGHDLGALVQAGRNNGLDEWVSLSQDDKEMLERMNEYYKTKELEYGKVGPKLFALYDRLSGLLSKLLGGVDAALRKEGL